MSGPSHCRLIIREGPFAGKEFVLEQPQVLLGRDPACDIHLEYEAVSRRHACLTWQGDHYTVEDLGSSNGTFLNDQRVKANLPLQHGDWLRLGQVVTLVFDDPAVDDKKTRFGQATVLELPQVALEEQGNQTRLGVEPVGPQIRIVVSGKTPQSYRLTGGLMTLGRAEDNDIIIPSPIVSRHHAVLEPAGGGYQFVPLPEAANPWLSAGQPLRGPRRLQHGDELCVESALSDQQVTLRYLFPADIQPSVQAALSELKGAPPDGTLLDVMGDLDLKVAPPSLVVTIAGESPRTITLLRERITLGRSEDNDIVISSPIVSRHHAQLERVPGGYQLIVLPDVSNTLVCAGKPVTGQRRLHHGDVLRLDSEIPGLMVTLVYQSPFEAEAAAHTQKITFGEKERLNFGRDPGNEVQLSAPTVSRFHAQVERIGRRYRLTDLRSANGTFVNDKRIETDTWLQPQDTIRIGSYRFIMGEDAFTRYDDTSGLRVEAIGINKWVRKNLNILQDISLVFQPREFIVVVGQSGGGKSTLVDAIAGYRPATQGRVYVNGIDVYHNFDAIRNEIGFVPQRDIIHMELTVYQALDYAAKLRMPQDTTKEERHKRIMEVLEDLDLVHRKDVQISGLSGGQQKRVSIGVELLTRPGLFFLDEPTSGLDPGTETAFMHLMRRLSDGGRTIVMVTHATKNVMLADKVVFLARGGYLAWFGPPEEALEYFDQYRSERERRSRSMEFDQIYAILDEASKGSPQDWAKRFKENPAYSKYISQPLQARQANLPLVDAVKAAAPAKAQRPQRRRQASSLRQFLTLSARNLKILTRDRTSMVLMLLAAPLVALLDFVIAPLMGRDPYNVVNGDASNSAITLFLLTIYALLVGGLSQMREFVKEGDIYKRERLVNLKIFPYVTSKVWVALLLAFYQAASYTIIHHIAFDMPGGALEFGLFYLIMVLAVLAGMMGGLLVSAIAPSGSAAPLLMILLLIPQIVLSGALAPVPGPVSAIASTSWVFKGLIGVVGIGSDIAADPCWQLSADLREAMTLEDKAANGCRCMGVAVFDPQSCNFPGIGEYYKPEVNQLEPVKPPTPGEKPAEPVIPAAPDPPADQYDQIAVAQYLSALQAYQQDVTRVQDDYKNQMKLFEAQAKVYQAEMAKYQEDYTRWNVARNGAVKGAEGLIESITKEFGWAWVDKHNSDKFWSWIVKDLAAQLLIILVYFVLILWMIKRKDLI